MENKPGRLPENKKKPGLVDWAGSLEKIEDNLRPELKELLEKNEQKVETMTMLRLPQLKHYGKFESVEEIRAKVKPEAGEQLIIRYRNKKTNKFGREKGLTLDQVCDYAEHLPGGMKEWDVEVNEYYPGKVAGTIIIHRDGTLRLEVWHGAHNVEETSDAKVPKYIGVLDPKKFSKHIEWTTPKDEDGNEVDDLDEMQQYALKALRYFARNIKPKEGEYMFVDFIVRDDNSFAFIDATDAKFLTK